jgi:hypothetical protein
MEKFIFTLLVVLCTQSLFAQSPKVFVSDSTKPVLQQQLLFQNRIIAKTEKETVYALPQDNMPVLVPDSSVTSNMPIALQSNRSRTVMPNPFYPVKPQIKKLPPTNKGYQYKPIPDVKKKIE